MKKKIAIIGLGDVGKAHFSELRRSDYFDLVGLCDKNLNDDFGEKFPLFDNINDFFNFAKPEAVIIATPCITHKELILRSLNFVKNIFVEAPLALSLSEMREINYAVKTNATKLCVGNNDRFNSTILSILKEIQKDSKIYSIKLNVGLNFSKKQFAVLNSLLKNLDLVRVISNSEISTSQIQKNFDSNEQIQAICCCVKTKSGILSSINISNQYPLPIHTIEICTNGGVYYGDLVGKTLHKITNEARRMNLRVDNDDFSLRYQHAQFLKLCENGENGRLATIEDFMKLGEISI